MIKALTPPSLDPVSDEDKLAHYLRSLSRMRLFIGLLGLLLPILLVGIDKYVFDERPWLRGSLSAYYYSGMREVFVATLAATGIFLITYRVGESSLSSTFTNIAGACALVIALFPTDRSDKKLPLTQLQQLLTERSVRTIHYGASAVFIGLLAVMSWYFAKQERHDLRKLNKERTANLLWWWHFTCFLAIASAASWMGVWKLGQWVGWLDPPHRYLLYGETVSAVAFGLSWLMMGVEIDRGSRRTAGAT